MPYALFDQVILAVDLPEKGQGAGTRGAVVEVYEKPAEGYIVEVFDNKGNTIDAFTVYPNQLNFGSGKRSEP
jgi:hypothetical protein